MVIAGLLANLNCKRSDLLSIRLELIRIRSNVRLIQELHLIWEKKSAVQREILLCFKLITIISTRAYTS